jgi:3'-phosphoadenosine 5'-phosphosulfate (PAPS) 3'-phosphatase
VLVDCAGGAGIKGLQVINGEVDAYIFPQSGTKKWDTCAFHALITYLNGQVTDSHGNEITYFAKDSYENGNGIVASIGNHKQYVLDPSFIVSKV